MNYKSKFIVFLILFLITTGFSQAQEVTVKKSSKIETVNGKKFYVHEVQKGETIYAISKAYEVDKNIIALENPEIFEKFSAGQIIHIPINTTDKKSINYKTHAVSKGETLYSISKKYNISIKELVKYNPETENGLQVGQQIKIPEVTTIKETVNTNSNSKDDKTQNKIQPTANNQINPEDTSKYIFHKVEKGQTLYSISKQYNITIDQIYQDNQELENNGLKVGETLKISKEKKTTITNDITLESNEIDSSKSELETVENYVPIASNTDCGKFVYKTNPQTFKIAVILPLQGDAITLEAEDEASINPNFEPNPKPFIEYYEGFLMAVDSLKRAGLNLSIKTIDLRKDSTKTQEILNKGELNDADLIVGPVFEANFKVIAEFAIKKGINIIYPINSKNSEINTNARVFVLNSSLYSQMAQATKYLASFNDLNYVTIHNNTPEELDIIKFNKQILTKEFAKNFNSQTLPYKEILYSSEGIAGVESALSKEKINILIIPSSNQIFVINILTKLQPLSKKYKLILSGMPSWKKFENNLELEYLYNLNMHTFVPFFVDYTKPSVIEFVINYRTKFKCEPSKFGFLGYDTGIYFLTALMNYGHDFQDCIQNQRIELTQSDFNFVKVSENGGYENNGIFILHYNQDNDVKVVNIVKDTMSLPVVLPDIQVRKIKQY